MATGTRTPPTELSDAIASILRGHIARKQLKQADVADAVGMSQSQLSGVLNGKKHVDVEQLDEICFAIGSSFVEVIAEAHTMTRTRTLSPEWTVKAL